MLLPAVAVIKEGAHSGVDLPKTTLTNGLNRGVVLKPGISSDEPNSGHMSTFGSRKAIPLLMGEPEPLCCFISRRRSIRASPFVRSLGVFRTC